jgi:hypothetical protein
MQVGKDPNERKVQAYGHSRPTYRDDDVDRRNGGMEVVNRTHRNIDLCVQITVATLICRVIVFKVRGSHSGEDLLLWVMTPCILTGPEFWGKAVPPVNKAVCSSV